MILFGERLCVREDEETPCTCADLANSSITCFCERSNFDTFLNSSLTVFQVITTEDWNGLLEVTMTRVNGISAVLYFVILFFIGNYIMMNLVVAILVQGCMERTVEEKLNKAKAKAEKQKAEHMSSRKTWPVIASHHSEDVEHLSDDEYDYGKRRITSPEIKLTLKDDDNVSFVTALEHTTDYNLTSSVQKKVAFGLHEEPADLVKSKFKQRYMKEHMEKIAEEEQLLESNLDSNAAKLHKILFHPDQISVNGEQEPPPVGKKLWVKLLQEPAAVSSQVCRECFEKKKKREMLQSREADRHIAADGLTPLVKIIPDGEEEPPFPRNILQRIRKFKNNKYYKKYIENRDHRRWNYSLFLYSADNSFRKKCVMLVNNKWFDRTIVGLIIYNCILMMFERPAIEEGSPERIFLDAWTNIFTIIFIAEMFVKCVANNAIFGPNAYVKSGWNILDGVLVIVSILSILADMFTAGNSPQFFELLRIMRLLRALRPLRVINRAPSLKLTVMSLATSVKDLGNILLICLMFFLIFGILGVQLLKGKMYFCDGLHVDDVITRADCESNPENSWVRTKFNFDNLIQALLTLFVVSTMDGWVGIMHDAIDAVGVDMQPQFAFAEWRAIYFVSFIVLMSFLLMNMVVGVLVDNYYEVNEKMRLEAIEHRMDIAKLKAEKKRRPSALDRRKMSTKQRLSLRRKETVERLSSIFKKKEGGDEEGLFDIPDHQNYGYKSMVVRRIVTHKYFDMAIAAVILANIIVMATEHYDMSPEWKAMHRTANYIFTFIFIAEVGVKAYGFTIKGYLRSGWNKIDLTIVLFSIIGIIITETSTKSNLGSNTKLLRMLRLTRIFRIVKLLKPAKGFMKLMGTLLRALPQVGNLAVLLGLQLFIFSAIGVEMFGRIECLPQSPCDGLNTHHAHFEHFGMAILTLFRISTGDNWSGIMKDTMKPCCDPNEDDFCRHKYCTNHLLAGTYFVIFVLMTQFILLNIVVAVLMKGFEDAADEETETNQLVEVTKIFLDRQLSIKPQAQDMEPDIYAIEEKSEDEFDIHTIEIDERIPEDSPETKHLESSSYEDINKKQTENADKEKLSAQVIKVQVEHDKN